jgi:hypothetical protein
MKCKNLFCGLFSVCLPVALLCALLTMPGPIQLWPQTSAEPSTNSSELSTALDSSWDNFDNLLNQQEAIIKSLGNGLLSTEGLNKVLSQNCADLRTFAAQAGERMQERDEDNYRKENKIQRQGHVILVMLLIIIGLCIPYIAKLAIWIARKFYGR